MEPSKAKSIGEIECPICDTINRITPEMRGRSICCEVCKVEFPAAELPFDISPPTTQNDAGAIGANQGWVYVISTKSMPNLVKVGYTTKSPKLRAKELSNTGNPHRYVVEYHALVPSPRNLEMSVHRRLASMREGREWFRCSVEAAIAAIRECGEGIIILEKVDPAQITKQEECAESYRAQRQAEMARRRRREHKETLERYKRICRFHSMSCPSCGTMNRVDLDRITSTTTDLLCGACKSLR